MATKLYKNTGKETITVLGLGELEAGAQVSVTGEHLPQIILENFPGLADITDETVEEVSSPKTQVQVKDEE